MQKKLFTGKFSEHSETGDVELFLWQELALSGEHEVIELLNRVEKGEVKGKIKLPKSKQFSSSRIIHNTVIRFLELRGVKVYFE